MYVMNLNRDLLLEFDQEMKITLRVLSELSEDLFDYKPHEKSMSTRKLANHIAELPSWVNGTLDLPELDFATAGYVPSDIDNKEDLIDFFNKNVTSARQSIGNTNDEHLHENWTLRDGEKIFFTMERITVLRFMVISHIIHHRAQLGVYLRLNDVNVPASYYGDSADEKYMYS